MDTTRALATGVIVLLCAALTIAIADASQAAPALTEDAKAALGKRMYLDGILPSGAPLSGTVQGDVSFPGTQTACASCHRRSGLGASEGGIQVLAVAGPVLYRPGGYQYRELANTRARGPGARPAYTDETLARAIREGVDSAGRVLDPLMPRYAVGDADLAGLIAYLKTLSDGRAPGVTGGDIHFATVVAEGVDPGTRKAMLDVLEAYFHDKNAGTRRETRRAENPPWHKQWLYQAYRTWVLHVWELRGPPQSWRQQMEQYYRQQPVFALVSGIASGSWRPVHAFCEDVELPCLFPNTDLPVAEDGNYYSMYFSKGMTLEAQALAKYLDQEHGANGSENIVQIYRDEDGGEIPARAFREAMRGRGVGRIRDHPITDGAPITARFWHELSTRERPSVLVVWLREPDLRRLASLAASGSHAPRIFLSASLLGAAPVAVSARLRDTTRFMYCFELPPASTRRLGRTRSWLRIKHIPVTDERVQANTFAAASLLAHAIKHMVAHFSRDYLLEKLEHIADSALSTSVYPSFSLAPGQRFASKGCYIVRPSAEPQGGVSAVSDWLVP